MSESAVNTCAGWHCVYCTTKWEGSREQSTAGRPDKAGFPPLLGSSFSKTPAVHLLAESDLTITLPSLGFFFFLELHAEAITNDSIFRCV